MENKPAEGNPAVSVIIVAWNSAAFLPRCLSCLSLQTYRDFEVILVDNASTDRATVGLTDTHPRLRLRVERLEDNLGFAAANDLAANLARGDWLALLNADSFPEPEWLERLLHAAHSYPNSFFASRQIQANRPKLLDGEGDMYHVSGLALRRNYNFPVFSPGEPREVFSACAAAALYPRQAFLDAGGFDPDYFMYHEDVDLGFRLRLRGMKCIYVPDAVIQHVGTASSGVGSFTSTYYGHRNLVWTYVKDMPSPWFWIHLPLHLIANFAIVAYFTLTGRGHAIWRAKIDAVRGLRAALGKRRLVQAQRRVSNRTIVQAMNRNPFAPMEGWIARHFPVTG